MPCPARPPPSLAAIGLPVRREIDRDERVVLLALRRRLARALSAGELAAVLAALERAVADARADARRLNDARISRRGERAQAAASPALPPALAAHACHGAYLGAFADLAAVGRMAVTTCSAGQVPKDMSEESLAEWALALHLRGVLWTLVHAGRVHVFRCP